MQSAVTGDWQGSAGALDGGGGDGGGFPAGLASGRTVGPPPPQATSRLVEIASARADDNNVLGFMEVLPTDGG